MNEIIRLEKEIEELEQKERELDEQMNEGKAVPLKGTFKLNEKRIELKAYKQGQQERIKSEIAFLESDEIKHLIHEADIMSCHDDYEPIVKRLKELKEAKQ